LIRNIDQEIDYLDRLIGNLLDMSRIEAGALTPKKEWHILDELVEGAIRRVERISKQQPLEVQLEPDLPPIFVDGLQVQQVLVNLLDNAIKFSPAGSSIRLTASLTEDSLEVGVSNVGEGLPSDEVVRIFERFYRVRSGLSAATPGLGLGLAICKSIVETHGGSIIAHSVPGGVTTISFRLPLIKTMPISAQTVAHA
jgi:two-component system sensor histidine kinase KdpD